MILVRVLEEEDIEGVSKIEERCFSMPWSPSSFKEMLESQHALYLVAEEDGVLLGCCGVRNILGDGEIVNVAVDLPYRRRGVAGCLMEKLLMDGGAMGIEAFTLEVRESNVAAISLYEKMGFVVEGRRPDFYEKPAENAIIMWKRNEVILQNQVIYHRKLM